MSDKASLRVFQINLNKSQHATESVLQLAIELQVDLILVQEPWLTPSEQSQRKFRNTRSISHPNFLQILPNHDDRDRPRTLVYVSRQIRSRVQLSPLSPQDPDMQIIEISDGNDKIIVVNIYNQIEVSPEKRWTANRCLYNQPISGKTIIAGDFNLHHSQWEVQATSSPEADKLVEWMEINHLELLNTPGSGTFFRPKMIRPSVIDLTIASPTIADRIEHWQVIPDVGSDHRAILFTIRPSVQSLNQINRDRDQFNTRKADWPKFTSFLKHYVSKSHVLSSLKLQYTPNDLELLESIQKGQSNDKTELLDAAAQELTECITKAAKESIPMYPKCVKSKPWWNSDLSEKRKIMARSLRKSKSQTHDTSRKVGSDYSNARNVYFAAIKKAKQAHWNEFLEKEDPKSIFKAMSYTKTRMNQRIPYLVGSDGQRAETFQEKCNTLRKTLFPAPPSAEIISWNHYQAGTWEWPQLSRDELKRACSAKIKGKTPGPDNLSQEIIIHAYDSIPDTFFRVYSTLIHAGYHPKCWKRADGAVLSKPNKPDYTQPKAFRVISLLNCLGKVSERVLAKRLGYLAETTELLHSSQVGGRLKKSAVDAALLLTNEVEVNKQYQLKTSALFLDVKGAFDHVALNQLLNILHNQQMPLSLIAWVASFLRDRSLRLTFDGETEEFSRIETGIPQGSPISPILFLIYIRNLFESRAVRFISYIDDIVMIAQSPSTKKNVKILERESQCLYQRAEKNAILFDLDKSELMHFTKEKRAKQETLILPSGQILTPKDSIKWIGVWFDPSLSFRIHISLKTAQAMQAFYRMTRLANIERGLSPSALRQIYLACITSVTDFASVVWWKGQNFIIDQLQSLQNLAMRKILGVFKRAPVKAMEVEAALTPPSIRLESTTRKYALRMAKLSKTHPVNIELNRDLKLAKSTQIKKIKKSIKSWYDEKTTEKIQNFAFPPWCSETPYSVIVSNTDKETAWKTHREIIKSHHPRKTTFLYTDSSYGDESKGIGVAVVATTTTKHVNHKISQNIGDNMSIFDGELEAITQAIEYASRISVPNHHYDVFSDSQSALSRLQIQSDQPGQACQLRCIIASTKIREKGSSISLHWVPGHSEIKGNMMADKTAKEASKSLPQRNLTSFAKIKQNIAETKISEWLTNLCQDLQPSKEPKTSYNKRFSWSLRKSIRLPPKTPRPIASAFFQLKLGHGYNKCYLHRIRVTENDRCRCGKKETPEHLLLSCKDYNNERRKLKDSMNGNQLSLNLLLHTDIGIVKTIDFLKKTRISTRRWHIERCSDEEDIREIWGEERD